MFFSLPLNRTHTCIFFQISVHEPDFFIKVYLQTDYNKLVSILYQKDCHRLHCSTPHPQGSGIGHVANNYLRPIPLLPKKTGFK